MGIFSKSFTGSAEIIEAAAQEIMCCGSSFSTTGTKWIYCVLKTVSKYVLTKVP